MKISNICSPQDRVYTNHTMMAIPNLRLLVACGMVAVHRLSLCSPRPPPLLYWEPGGRARLLKKSPFLASKTRSGTPENGYPAFRQRNS